MLLIGGEALSGEQGSGPAPTESLHEEATGEQQPADRQERRGASHRAQLGEVVEEDLRQRDAEQREPGIPEHRRAPRHARHEQPEPGQRPHRADRRVTTLEVRLECRTRHADGKLERDERDRIEVEHGSRTKDPST